MGVVAHRQPVLSLSCLLMVWLLLVFVPAAGQDPPGPLEAREASHRERFATPQERALRAETEADALLREAPDDARALRRRGMARLHLGRMDDAVADLSRAVALEPESADTRASLAFALWTQGRLAEALQQARTALEHDPRHLSANFYAGRILLHSGRDVAEAIVLLERAAEAAPDDPDIRFDLLMAYRLQPDLLNAGVQLRLLRATQPPNDARVLYGEGLLAADLGRMPMAADRFRQALAANPDLDSARQDLAMALVSLEEWEEAATLLAHMVAARPDLYEAAYLHALVLHNRGENEKAEAEVRRALSLQPTAAAYTLLGILQAARSDHAAAVQSLQLAVDLDDEHFDAYPYLGRARYALQDTAGARESFRRAVQLRPEDGQARFFLATLSEILGERDFAADQYRQVLQRDPRDARGHLGLGALLVKYGDAEQGIQHLRRARELAPDDFEAAMVLGRILTRAGQLEEGTELLREAVTRAPDNPQAHYQLGLALRRAGKTHEAEQMFAIVERLNRERRIGGMGTGASQMLIPEKD